MLPSLEAFFIVTESGKTDTKNAQAFRS